MIVDVQAISCYSVNMAKNNYLSDQLRQAIDDSGLSRYAIGKACEIDKAVMSRFMSGQVGLSLETIDRLVDYLRLELVTKQKKRSK